MQNATDLAQNPYKPTEEKLEDLEAIANFTEQLTTTYLQGNQTDFHILPKCNLVSCNALGTYVNDDGLTLDLTQRNTYTLEYKHDVPVNPALSPSNMTITFKQYGLKEMINPNDLLNRIEIYDATNLGMSTEFGAVYEVTVNFIDNTRAPEALSDAFWDAKGDKLKV